MAVDVVLHIKPTRCHLYLSAVRAIPDRAGKNDMARLDRLALVMGGDCRSDLFDIEGVSFDFFIS